MKTIAKLLITGCLGILSVYSVYAQSAGALDFTSGADHVRTASFTSGTQITVEAWVKFTSITGNQQLLNCGANPNIVLEKPANGAFRARMWDGAANVGVVMGGSASVGVWTHLAYVYDYANNHAELFVNGNSVGTSSAPSDPTLTASRHIGQHSNASQQFIGEMDEFRFWNTARSQSDIQADMSCELDPSDCNLLVYYDFNNAGAAAGGNNAGQASVTDQSVNGNHGTLNSFALSGTTSNWTSQSTSVSGTCGSNPCPTAGAIHFDGNNDLITAGSPLLPTTDQPFSIEAWVKADNFNENGMIVGQYVFPQPTRGGFIVKNNAKLEFYNAGSGSIQSSGTLTANAWHHIAMTKDASGNILLYINGVQDGSGTNNVGLNNSNTTIGNSDSGGGSPRFNGTIDEVRIWNTALCQAQIVGRMNCELTGSESGLVAYYNFNNASASIGGSNAGQTSLIDNSGNGNTATLTDFGLSGSSSNWTEQTGSVSGSCGAVPCGSTIWTGTTSSDWNTGGNWSTGSVPGASDDVVIADVANDPIISAAVTINDVEVEGGALLIVGSDGTLTLDGELANAGTVTIEDGGSFMQGASSSITGSGTFNVRRQGGSLYNMWSSPVAAHSGIPGTSYQYNSAASTQDDSDDEEDPGWSAYNGTMTPGKGYAGLGGGLATFTGTPNNGNINYGLYYTAFDNTFSQTTPGTPFNLVGNPYPSAISAASFLAANTDLDGTIYLWNDNGSNNYSRTDYAYWNGTGGLGTGGGITPNGYIASCQGFMVRALSGATVANFTNGQRVVGNNTQFHRASAEASRLWFSVENETERDEILIGFLEEATEGEDRMYDAVKLQGNGLNLSTLNENTEYAILAVPPIIEERTIPLSVEITEAGEYTFTPNTMENLEGQLIYFNDLQTGMSVQLEEGQPITLHLETGDYTNRFFLNFSEALATSIDEAEANDLQAWVTVNTLNVRLSNATASTSVQLIDMNGRVVRDLQRVALQNGQGALSIDGLAGGIYTVLATTENTILTEKVFVK